MAPHPVQMHRQFPGHGYFRDLSSSAHTEVEKLAPPLRLTAHGHLGRFHQQIARQGVPLLADMSETSAIAAGFLRRNQPHIAGRFACRSVLEFQSPTRTLVPAMRVIFKRQLRLLPTAALTTAGVERCGSSLRSPKGASNVAERQKIFSP